MGVEFTWTEKGAETREAWSNNLAPQLTWTTMLACTTRALDFRTWAHPTRASHPVPPRSDIVLLTIIWTPLLPPSLSFCPWPFTNPTFSPNTWITPSTIWPFTFAIIRAREIVHTSLKNLFACPSAFLSFNPYLQVLKIASLTDIALGCMAEFTDTSLTQNMTFEPNHPMIVSSPMAFELWLITKHASPNSSPNKSELTNNKKCIIIKYRNIMFLVDLDDS